MANSNFWPSEARRAERGGPGRLEGIKKAMLKDMTGEVTSNKNINSVWE